MMSARVVTRAAVVAAAMLLAAGAVQADITVETVPVRNTGNAGEWSGESYGGSGTDRICGAVDYTYNMGKFEVTAGQYTVFLNAVAATDAYNLYNTNMDTAFYSYGCNIKRTGAPGIYIYTVAADWANRPVNLISWGDAARFANWLTNGQLMGAQDLTTTEDGSYYLNGATSNEALQSVLRKSPEEGGRYYIPTEDEWYKAAYHQNDGDTGNYFDYPTGSNILPSNDRIDPDPGNNANYYIPNADYTIGSPYWRTADGEFENSESPYVTFDQGGNVREWIETILDDSSDARGVRGGSCTEGGINLGAPQRYGHERPANENPFLGFRVCEVPEPATLALLALGGAGVLMRLWRR